MKADTIYGKIENGEYEETFKDENVQSEFVKDFSEMIAKVDDEKFFNKYYKNRLAQKDPEIVKAIYAEYAKRIGKPQNESENKLNSIFANKNDKG